MPPLMRMPCKPRDILELARGLGVGNGTDASLRSSISRAYYAALLAADSTFLPKNGHRVDGESSHAEIIGRATAHGNRLAPGRQDARLVAKGLQRLRRLRNFCDYQIDQEFPDTEHLSAFIRAERIVEQCEGIVGAIQSASEKKPPAGSTCESSPEVEVASTSPVIADPGVRKFSLTRIK